MYYKGLWVALGMIALAILLSFSCHGGIGETLEQIEAKTGVHVATLDQTKGDYRYVVYQDGNFLYEISFFNGRSVVEAIGRIDGGELARSVVLYLLSTYSDDWVPCNSPDNEPEAKALASPDGRFITVYGPYDKAKNVLRIYDRHWLDTKVPLTAEELGKKVKI